ncbi:hypothetical protein DICVIV_05021 [Dictyocaulus viviparus]|uniref:Metaxin glutathione S-transferase domain-containing protein n=1 Tax=Dictyocaulus viviparus TaxID=29172 RepID=A0A0D8Y2N5_DICVI|nr:hypothetical protein DICVIV_05021 [Dictyocaulus viviparus]
MHRIYTEYETVCIVCRGCALFVREGEIPSRWYNVLGISPYHNDVIRKRVDGVLGNISRDESKELLRRDIQAIDDVLQDKKFLFGGQITVADCAVFAQLATTFFLPYRQIITDYLGDEFPRVGNYVQRIRSHYYPEWRGEYFII